MMLRDHLPRLSALAPVALPALLAVCAGCAGERDAMQKQIVDLRAEIARMRASEASLTERVGMLEVGRGAPTRSEAAAVTAPIDHPGSAPAGAVVPARPADRDRPELDVVRISPSEGDGDADSEATRPVIRAVGNERPTLSVKTTGARAPRKGAPDAPSKKPSDADVRPVVKP